MGGGGGGGGGGWERGRRNLRCDWIPFIGSRYTADRMLRRPELRAGTVETGFAFYLSIHFGICC